MDGIAVDPADFADVAEHVVFVQAKFHDIDENLEDQQIPWEPVLRALKDAGYTGYLSSEYEGEREPWRSIEQVRRQHSLMRQVADQPLNCGAHHDAASTQPKEHSMPNGLIAEDSLRVHPEGFALSLTLPWYRSLWLSSVTSLQLTLDGEEVPAEDLAFELQGVRYSLDQLPEQSDVLWYLQEHPLLIVARETPLELGETHEVRLVGQLRLPYMQIAPGEDGGPGMYVPNFVNQTLTLTATDRDAAPPALVSDVPPPPPATDADPFKLGLDAVLGECGVPRGLVRLRQPARARRRARHRPRHRDRRVAGAADVPASSPTSSSATGAPRSTSTASTRARSAPTSTWAVAATAT